MTAERGRAPVVTTRVTAEWRFGYRESEYNIAVTECFSRFSPYARGAVGAGGVPRDARDARGRGTRAGELASRRVAVYATPTRESAVPAPGHRAAATLALSLRGNGRRRRPRRVPRELALRRESADRLAEIGGSGARSIPATLT